MIRSIKRPMKRSMIASMIGSLTTASTVSGGFVDPVPGSLFHYLMDSNDSALTGVNSPTIVTGLELPDQKAALLNGVDQYYASTDGSAIATIGTGAFTLSFWMNSSDPFGNHVPVATGVGTDADDFRLRTTNSAKLQFRSGGVAITTPTTIVANTDYLVTIDSTGSGGTLNIYLNNVLDMTATSPPYNFNNPSKLLYVGSVNAGSQLWDGRLDAIRFFPFVLSAGERLSLLNNVNPNLVTNGDFGNGTTDWTSRNDAGLSVTSNVMEVTDATGLFGSAATQAVNLVAGKTYIFNCFARKVTGGNPAMLIEWEGGGDTGVVTGTSTAFEELTFEFTPINTSGDGGFDYNINLREDGNTAGDIAEFKNVSVREKFS